MTIRRRLAIAGLGLPLLGYARSPGAQGPWPERPVRIVVPYPPGGFSDLLSRQVAELLQQELRQPAVVENRPGAQGVIGTVAAARSAPDGYTLLCLGASVGAANMSLIRNPPYDTLRDFSPVGMMALSPFMLVAAPDLPVQNAADLMALLRSRNGQMSYGYSSSTVQAACALLAKMADADIIPVPYRGTPETLNDVMVGRVNYVFTDLAASLALARDGRVKALGVTSKDTYPLVPDLSPLDRSGAPGFEMGTWFGLVAPAGTPTAIIELANVALERALLQERLATRLQAQGFTPQPMAAAAFRSLIDNEIVKWRQWATELKLEQTSPRRFMKLWKASHAALREGVWRTRVIGAG